LTLLIFGCPSNLWLYTVRKVIVFKQEEFNSCTCETTVLHSGDLFRAEM